MQWRRQNHKNYGDYVNFSEITALVLVFMNLPGPLSMFRCLALVVAGLGGVVDGATLWSLPVRFTEFQGRPGGFEANGSTPLVLEDGSGDGETTRSYDILRPGAAAGVVVRGQDGAADLSVRSVVLDNDGGRWGTLQLERDRGRLNGHATVTTGTSRMGDSAVMAFELTFAAGLGVTADQLAVNLAGINGRGDLYEWAFVTVGGVEEAPFDPAAAADYTAYDYNVVPGGMIPGQGPNAVLANGRPMSAFLAGENRTTATAGLVEPGWWAADGFNVAVKGNVEGPQNPAPSATAAEKSFTVTGAALGLVGTQLVEKVTVWFGFNDVAFDTNGNGFTRTAGNQTQRLASITLGASTPSVIPEPELAVLVPLGLAFLLFRSRYRISSRATSR